jgi:hypothetical protein
MFRVAFSVITLLVIPTLTRGDNEPLRERFLKEARDGWLRIKAAARHVDGIAEKREARAGKTFLTEQVRFKVNGDFFVCEEDRKITSGDQGELKEIRRIRAVGTNSKYWFALRRKKPDSSWALAGTENSPDSTHVGAPLGYAVLLGLFRYLDAPFTIMCMPLASMVGESGFKLERIEEVRRNERKLAKVTFRYTAPPEAVAFHKDKNPRVTIYAIALRGGWMLLDPEASWALQEYSVEILLPSNLGVNDPVRVTGAIEYKNAKESVPLPFKVVLEDFGQERTEFTFQKLVQREVPEEELTVSAYGLPEPVVTRKQRGHSRDILYSPDRLCSSPPHSLRVPLPSRALFIGASVRSPLPATLAWADQAAKIQKDRERPHP